MGIIIGRVIHKRSVAAIRSAYQATGTVIFQGCSSESLSVVKIETQFGVSISSFQEGLRKRTHLCRSAKGSPDTVADKTL